MGVILKDDIIVSPIPPIDSYNPDSFVADLHIIAIDPVYQGQGAAAALLSWGEGLARRDQMGVYLEATIAGYPVYNKRNYEVTGESIVASDGSFDVSLDD